MFWKVLIPAVVLVFASGAVAQTDPKVPKSAAKPPSAKAPAKASLQPHAASPEEAERVKTIEQIFECLASGLPQDWWQAWVEFAEREGAGWNDRIIEGRFFYLIDAERTMPQELKTCGAREVAELTYSLNQFLNPDQRRWKAARLEFNRGGSFELNYDYGK